MPWKLSTFPHVAVCLVCEGCGRRGRYRLARLAVRFGAETDLATVLESLAVGCKQRTPASGGCGARIVLPGETARSAKGPGFVPPSRRNPRRAYDRDGREMEPARLASIMPPVGTGQVVARCQRDGCGHQAVIDVTAWPADTYVPDVALRLRCGICGARRPWTVPVHKDRGPGPS